MARTVGIGLQDFEKIKAIMQVHTGLIPAVTD